MRRLFNEFVNRGDHPARESFQLMVGLVDCCVRGGMGEQGAGPRNGCSFSSVSTVTGLRRSCPYR